MRRQFIALVRPAAEYSDGNWQRRLLQLRSFPLLKCVHQSPLVAIFATGAMPIEMLADGVTILGDVFCHDRPWRPNDADVRATREAGGDSLFSACWGEYVAFINDGAGRTHIVRDPSGAIPVYLTDIEGIHVLSSDANYIRLLQPRRFIINRDMIAYAMAFEGMKTARTCIEGVDEILPGQKATVGLTGLKITSCWTPWAFADRKVQVGAYDDAVSLVKEAVTTTLATWGARCGSPTAELSGGLDSSIVTACLCQACPSAEAMTLLMTDPRADERRYARMVSNEAGCPLTEVPLRVEDADIKRLPESLTFRPGHGVLSTASDRAILRAARPETDAFFGGAGGDDIFCYLSTAGSVADTLICRGIGGTFLTAAAELASIHTVTTWKTAWYGLKKALRGPRVFPAQTQFLADACAEMTFDHHPWLSKPKGALPGKYEHIMSLVGAQTRGEGKDRSNLAPVRLPLLSQPVVEACLRIPTWMWTHGGRDRAVARDAFKDVLPPAIINRRTKGDFASFNWDVYARNQSAIRELLLDGYLKQANLLDHIAVEAHLNRPEPHRSPAYSRLVRLAAIEVWCAEWMSSR